MIKMHSIKTNSSLGKASLIIRMSMFVGLRLATLAELKTQISLHCVPMITSSEGRDGSNDNSTQNHNQKHSSVKKLSHVDAIMFLLYL